MKKYIFPLALSIFSQNALALQCFSGDIKHEISQCKESSICVESSNIDYTLAQDASNIESIECIDVNFDGQNDILVNHLPSGQVKMSSAFIYKKSENLYIKNEEISSLPCLKINSKTKQISGTCFSSSLCDHWSEQYIIKNSKLDLYSIKGTYCDPATGAAYGYYESYMDGKIINKKVEKISDSK